MKNRINMIWMSILFAIGFGAISCDNGSTSGDRTAPALSAGSVSRTSDTHAAISFTTDEAGTAYYLVKNSGAAAPAKMAVRAGTSLGAVTSGANSGKPITLTAGAKDIYVVVEDSSFNISVPLKIEAAAYDSAQAGKPSLSAGSVSRTSDTQAAIGFTTDKAGTAYYLVVEKDAAAPASAAVKAGTSLGSVSGTVTGKSVTLTAGAKDIYVAVENSTGGEISDPLKIQAAAYVAPDTTAPTLSDGSVNRTSDTEAVISFTTDEAGTAYYLVKDTTEAAPANTAVKAGTSLGAATVGANSSLAVTLTAGAKDIYVVVVDDAGNISTPLKIAAAAYVVPDTTAPTLSDGSGNRTSDTAATIGFTTDEAGTAYYLMQDSGEDAPANTAVKAGISLGAVTVGANSSLAVTLTKGAKDIYVVVEDDAGNISDPLKIEAAAYVDTTAPALSAGSVNRSSNTQAAISFTTDEAGTAYYLVQDSGEDAPANTAVKDGTSLGAVTVGVNSSLAVTLTAGAKDIYVVVEDDAGNISDPLKIEAAAIYAIGDTGPAGGIIFYVDAGGFTMTGIDGICHYLEASPENLTGGTGNEAWMRWSTATGSPYPATNGTLETIGSGKNNTAIIISAESAAYSGDTHIYAARACSEYSGGGKNDWFLPSKNELNELYKAKVTTGIPTTGSFWSSSQDDYGGGGGGGAWCQDFDYGDQGGSYKRYGYNVRAVRAF